jgi:hypothetical protein
MGRLINRLQRTGGDDPEIRILVGEQSPEVIRGDRVAHIPEEFCCHVPHPLIIIIKSADQVFHQWLPEPAEGGSRGRIKHTVPCDSIPVILLHMQIPFLYPRDERLFQDCND